MPGSWETDFQFTTATVSTSINWSGSSEWTNEPWNIIKMSKPEKVKTKKPMLTIKDLLMEEE